MGLRRALIMGMAVGLAAGLVAQGSAPVVASSQDTVTIQVVVTGRLLGQEARLRVHDRSAVQRLSVGDSAAVAVHKGRVTIVPSPIAGDPVSTARIRRITAGRATVIHIRYSKDSTSRPGR